MIPNMAPHGENAKPVDPLGALMARVHDLAQAQPLASAADLVSDAANELAMRIEKAGTARILGNGSLAFAGWALDAREWIKREHGIVLGGVS